MIKWTDLVYEMPVEEVQHSDEELVRILLFVPCTQHILIKVDDNNNNIIITE